MERILFRYFMQQYLPSKQFFIVVGILAIFTGSIFGVQAYIKHRNLIRAQEEARLAAIIPISTKNIDSDGDGLLDWEEAAMGTNPYKIDTDGDGTTDSIEVALRRDPLTKGPNDYMSIISTTTVPVITSAENLTETEKMMRTMLTLAVRDPQNNADLPEAISKEVIDTLNKKTADLPIVFTENNIKSIVETETSLRQYGNDFGTILAKYDSQETERIKLSYLIMMSLKTRDASVFQAYPAIIKAKQKEITALSKIKVPKDMVALHVNVLNRLSHTIIAIENTGLMVSDPAKGLIGMKQYKAEIDGFYTAIDAVNNHLDNSGIVFKKDEAGYILKNLNTKPI